MKNKNYETEILDNEELIADYSHNPARNIKAYGNEGKQRKGNANILDFYNSSCISVGNKINLKLTTSSTHYTSFEDIGKYYDKEFDKLIDSLRIHKIITGFKTNDTFIKEE